MIFKQSLIFVLLVMGSLSAKTTVATQEPVKKTLSQRKKVVPFKVAFVSSFVMGGIVSKPLFDRLLSKNIGITTKALWVLALVGASLTLKTIEEKFFEKYPYLLGPCEESETKQENVPC